MWKAILSLIMLTTSVESEDERNLTKTIEELKVFIKFVAIKKKDLTHIRPTSNKIFSFQYCDK